MRLFDKIKNILNLGKEPKESYKNEDLVEALLVEAIKFNEKGNTQGALICLFKAENLNPNHLGTLILIGAILSSVNNDNSLKKSIEYFDRALEIKPDAIQALNNKGSALEGLGKCEKAIKCYNKALQINPTYIQALNNKGRALKILGKYKEAIKYFDKVLKIDPSYKKALYNKSDTLETMGKFKESLSCLDNMIVSEVGTT